MEKFYWHECAGTGTWVPTTCIPTTPICTPQAKLTTLFAWAIPSPGFLLNSESENKGEWMLVSCLFSPLSFCIVIFVLLSFFYFFFYNFTRMQCILIMSIHYFLFPHSHTTYILPIFISSLFFFKFHRIHLGLFIWTLQKREQEKALRAQGWGGVLWNVVFWKWHGCHTHELIGAVVTCTRLLHKYTRRNWKLRSAYESENTISVFLSLHKYSIFQF